MLYPIIDIFGSVRNVTVDDNHATIGISTTRTNSVSASMYLHGWDSIAERISSLNLKEKDIISVKAEVGIYEKDGVSEFSYKILSITKVPGLESIPYVMPTLYFQKVEVLNVWNKKKKTGEDYKVVEFKITTKNSEMTLQTNLWSIEKWNKLRIGRHSYITLVCEMYFYLNNDDAIVRGFNTIAFDYAVRVPKHEPDQKNAEEASSLEPQNAAPTTTVEDSKEVAGSEKTQTNKSIIPKFDAGDFEALFV